MPNFCDTSAENHAATHEKGLNKRADIPGCGVAEAMYGPVGDAIACFNYLRSLGTTRCEVGDNIPVQMVRVGDTHVTGQTLTGNVESSYWYVDTLTLTDIMLKD